MPNALRRTPVWLLLVAWIVALTSCRLDRSRDRLGEGPPTIDDGTLVLATFDPAALSGPAATGIDFTKTARDTPPPKPTLPPPAIVDYGPTARASGYQDVHVRFNRPMVPLGEKVRMTAAEAGFTFDPPIAGEAYWAEPTRLVFQPDDELPPATEIDARFDATLTAIDGPPLQAQLQWRFATPGPEIDMWVADDGYGEPYHWKSKVFLYSSHPVALSALRRVTRAEYVDDNGDTHELPVRIRKGKDGGGDLGFVLTPVDPWPAGREVVIRVDGALKSTVGPRTMGHEEAYAFDVADGVRVELTRCVEGEYQDGCELGPFVLEFSTPISRKQAKHVRVTPTERGAGSLAVAREYDWERDRPSGRDRYLGVQVWGEFERGKPYTVTVDPQLRDVYGQAFTGESSFEFEFVEPEPEMRVSNARATFSPTEPAKIGVDARHVENLSLRVAVLGDDAAADAFTTLDDDYWPSKAAAPTHTDTIAPAMQGSFGWSSTAIDLANYTGGRPAVVRFEVAPDGLLPRARGRRAPTGASGLIQITDLGLTLVHSLPGGVIRVASLTDDRPLARVRIEQVDDDDAPIELGTTDADGLLRLGDDVHFPPRCFLRASLADDRVYVPCGSIPSAPTRTGDEPLRGGESVRTTLMSERPLYRPGERVRAMGWAAIASPYEFSGLRTLPGGTPVAIELRDFRNELVDQTTVHTKEHGKFWATLDVPAEAPLGDYWLSASILGAGQTAALEVKDFVAPDFEVEATTEHADLHHGESTTVTVNGRYYFGGGVPITRTREYTTCAPQRYRPPTVDAGWPVAPAPDYRRGHGAAIPPSIGRKPGPGAADGHLEYPLTPHGGDPHIPARCTHSIAIADATEREVGAEADLWLHPPFYLASASPFSAEEGDDIEIPVRTLDFDGSGLAVDDVRVRVVRRWSEPEYDTEDGERIIVGYRSRERELPACETATKADGQTTCRFRDLKPGDYSVTVVAEQGEFAPTVEDWFWVHAKQPPRPPRRTIQELEITPSDRNPKVGDTVRVDVRAPWKRGRAVVMVVKGGIHEVHPVTLDSGLASIELEVDDGWSPRVEFVVFAVDRRSALFEVDTAKTRVDVGLDARTLSVAVSAPTEAQTGETIPIEIAARDSAGEPVAGHVSVWAVDEAVLSLSPLQLPAFVEAFRVDASSDYRMSEVYRTLRRAFAPGPDLYRPRAFDPRWRTSTETIGGYGYGFGASGAGYGGGGGGIGRMGSAGAPIVARSKFSSAPIFVGDAEVGADGIARVEGTLPDNLTTFRLTAVVSAPLTSSPVEARFGTGDARVRVTRPLVVRAALPRILRPGDNAEVGVMIDNRAGGAGQVEVEVELTQADGVLELIDAPSRSLPIGAGEQLRVPFRVRALASGSPEFEARARLTPTAAGNRNVADGVRLPVPVEAERTLSDRVAVYGSLSDADADTDAGTGTGASAALLPFALPTAIDPNFGGLSISVGSTILGGVEDAVAYLVQYPYGCVEQTSSSLLPLAPLGQLVRQGYPMGIDEPERYIRAGVERLAAMQLSSGGFAYWPGGTVESPYASAYAAWVLWQVRAAGYHVPEVVLDQALGYVAHQVDLWAAETAPSKGEDIQAAQMLWTLSAAGRTVSDEALTTLFERRHHLPVFATAMLALTIADRQVPDPRAEVLLRELASTLDEREAVAKVETDSAWTGYWDTDVRSSALVLLAYLALDPQHPLVPKLARGLLEARRGGRWSNTQENAYSLVALATYARIYEADEPNFEGRVWLANEAVASIAVEGRAFEFSDAFTPMAELVSARAQPGVHSGASPTHDVLILERAGTGRMYYRVGLEWASTATDLPAKAEGITVARTFRTAERTIALGDTVDSGSLMAVDLTIEIRADLDFMAVEIPLPAGLEAIDLDLGKGTDAMKLSGGRASWVSHQELRRDRAVVFADHLSPGTHRTTVFLRATTPGDYVVPAASAELMYYPEIYGRTTSGRLRIR